jgi:hypothetical protein
MISAFEYVTVFISIILGLGVTQILTGIADLVHQNERVKIYPPHLVWVFLVLVLHVQEWWVTFQLRSYGPWRLPVFLFILLYPVVLFILARLLFPFGINEGAIDLKKFYFENYRRIFLFGAMLAFLSILDNLFIRDFDFLGLIAQSTVLVFLAAMAIMKNSRPWLHQAVATFMFILLTTSIIIEWDSWLVSN